MSNAPPEDRSWKTDESPERPDALAHLRLQLQQQRELMRTYRNLTRDYVASHL